MRRWSSKKGKMREKKQSREERGGGLKKEC
jgi:hypothetical protein